MVIHWELCMAMQSNAQIYRCLGDAQPKVRWQSDI